MIFEKSDGITAWHLTGLNLEFAVSRSQAEYASRISVDRKGIGTAKIDVPVSREPAAVKVGAGQTSDTDEL
jgi:hypothetical protein